MDGINLIQPNSVPHFSFGHFRLKSPRDDIQSKFLELIGSAQESIYIMIYGFHLPALTDLLIAKHQAGLDVRLILDLSQSKGKAESEEVQKLKDAGLNLIIGTSPVAHQIMHEKETIIDGKRVLSGSWNYSLSAQKQVNHMDFFYSKEMAADSIFDFNQLWQEILAEGHK